MQARWALVGSLSEVVLLCMYVCMFVCMYGMSVRNGFTIKIYGFMHSYVPFGTCHS